MFVSSSSSSSLQHEEDEIEMLLSEDSTAIDPSLWETTTTTTTALSSSSVQASSKEQPSNAQRRRQRRHCRHCCCHNQSFLLCSMWISLSILLGILMTFATDHSEDIRHVVSQQWTNTITALTSKKNASVDREQQQKQQQQKQVLGNTSSTTTNNHHGNSSNYHNKSSTEPTINNNTHSQKPQGVPSSHTENNNNNKNSSSNNSSIKKQQQQHILRLPPQGELPHVVFDNLKYRRVCANVYASILCLTIRYPFEVPLQDATVSFPKPVDDRFYHLGDLILLDGVALEACRRLSPQNNSNQQQQQQQQSPIIAMRDRVHTCLEQEAARHSNNNNDNTVVAVFTRRIAKAGAAGQHDNNNDHDNEEIEEVEDFYGTGSALQQQRIGDFFRGHVVVIIGASPAPHVTYSLAELFGTCTKVTRGINYNCNVPSIATAATTTTATTSTQPTTTTLTKSTGHDRHQRYQQRHRRRDMQQQQEQEQQVVEHQTWLRVRNYYPTDVRSELPHVVNTTQPIVEMLRKEQASLLGELWPKNNSLLLRPLSIVVDFPIAHSQTEHMIHNNWDQVQYNQVRLAEMIMNITTATEELAEMGFSLRHIIAFDGLPQHFPSETGAYPDLQRRRGENETFFLQHPYPGWRAELGSTCRGPLPPNSKLKQVNEWERHAFTQYGLPVDQYYGKTWEFSNQFWWQEKMWKGKDGIPSLDCTHPRQLGSGATAVHKFFLQAMVDGYYEQQQQQKEEAKKT